ncbi:MAG: transposase, partial [Magnetococcales bacterium]|nr:transposase [Magnetococcales bacterium]
LQERFGSVSDAVRQQVTSAGPDDLTAWSKKILRAESLQAVFQ